MKKLIFTTAALLMSMVSVSTFAQSESKGDVIVGNEAFCKNWFVSGGIGTSVYMGDADRFGSFGSMFAPAIDVAVGKWITPYIGARLQYSGPSLRGNTYSQTNEFAEGSIYGDDVYRQSWNYMYLHADAMFNVSNYIHGYEADRFYSFIPYAGAGWARTTANGNDAFGVNLGIYNSFALNTKLDAFIDVRGTVIGDDSFDAEVGSCGFEGIATATVGLSYKFGKQGWVIPVAQSVIAGYEATLKNNAAVIDNYKSQIAAAEQENATLQDELDAAKRAAAEAGKVKAEIPSSIVRFDINSAKLTNAAKVNLDGIAKFINEYSTNETYEVIGYADNKTGNKRFNDKLSAQRAQVVYDYLTNEGGVEASKLNVSSKGGVDNMFFNDFTLSRVVIIK